MIVVVADERSGGDINCRSTAKRDEMETAECGKRQDEKAMAGLVRTKAEDEKSGVG